MTIDQAIKLLEVVVSLIQTVTWPFLVLFILIYLGEPLKQFMSDLSRFNFKAGPTGLEASAERQAEAAALLGVAAANKTEGSATQTDEEKARAIASVVSQAAQKSGRALANSLILWVDDAPSRNFWERKSLEAFGVRFAFTKSVKDALEKLQAGKYDAIIFSLGRNTDQQAAFVLLEEQKRLGDNTPLILYGSMTPQQWAEARRRGVAAHATNPLDLFQTAGNVIKGV